MFRSLRSGLRPHTRFLGYAADSIGRYALKQTALAVAPVLACSCAAPPSGPAGPELPLPEGLAETHNERVSRVDVVYARGVMELRWDDEDGRHFEQGDLDLWLDLPHRTALNVSKFGERLMWLGSNETAGWVFEFGDGLTVLRLAVGPAGDRARGQLPIDPADLVALCGLMRLDERARVAYDEGLDAWVIGPPPDGAGLRVYLDREKRLPVRAELRDEAGGILFYSGIKLQRYDRLGETGAAPGSAPLVPTLVDIFGTGGFEAKLAVRDPTADEQEQRADYFDLDWLTGKFPPDRVEGAPPLAATGDG